MNDIRRVAACYTPDRPLLTEPTDIERGLQELGHISAGLANVEDVLEEWGDWRVRSLA